MKLGINRRKRRASFWIMLVGIALMLTTLGAAGAGFVPNVPPINQWPLMPNWGPGSMATVTGTALTADEDSIRAGGRTIIIELPAGQSWVADLTTNATVLNAFIAGITGDGTSGDAWDDTVRPSIGSANVSRDSNTQVTVTLPATADYNHFGPTAETISILIPTSAISGSMAIEALKSGEAFAFQITSELSSTDLTTIDTGLAAFAGYLQEVVDDRLSESIYTVEDGDTCDSIASETGATVDQLLDLNGQGAVDPSNCNNLISAGQPFAVGTEIVVPRFISPFGALASSTLREANEAIEPLRTLNFTTEVGLKSALEGLGATVSIDKEKFSVDLQRSTNVSIDPISYGYIDDVRGEIISLTTDSSASLPIGFDLDFLFTVMGGEFVVDVGSASPDEIRASIGTAAQQNTGTATGRLGFVDVTASTAFSADDAGLEIDLVDADGYMTTAEFNADLNNLGNASTSISGAIRGHVSDVTVGDNLLPTTMSDITLRWNDIDGQNNAVLVDNADTTITLADSDLGSKGMDRFANASAEFIIAGLDFLALWFGDASQAGPLGTPLPFITGTSGDRIKVISNVIETEYRDLMSTWVQANADGKISDLIFAISNRDAPFDGLSTSTIEIIAEQVNEQALAVSLVLNDDPEDLLIDGKSIVTGGAGSFIDVSQSLQDQIQALKVELNRLDGSGNLVHPNPTASEMVDIFNAAWQGPNGADVIGPGGMTLLTENVGGVTKPTDLRYQLAFERELFAPMHVVQPGDTCSSIASGAGITLSEMLALNSMTSESECNQAIADGIDKLFVAEMAPDLTFDMYLGAQDILFTLDRLVNVDGVTAKLVGTFTFGVRLKNHQELVDELVIDLEAITEPLGVNLNDLTAAERNALTDGHRMYLVESDDIVSIDIKAEDDNIDVGTRLGILDLMVTGAFDLEPEIEFGLTDPGASSGLVTLGDNGPVDTAFENDGLVDLPELAASGDSLDFESVEIEDVVTGMLDGTASSTFRLKNDLLSVDQNLTANGSVGNVTVSDISPLPKFQQVTIDDLKGLVAKTNTWIGGAGDLTVVNEPIPLVDTRIEDLVNPGNLFQVVSDRVAASSAKDITAFHASFCEALRAAGQACGLDASFDQDVLRFAFTMGRSQSAVLPLAFDTEDFTILGLDEDSGPTVSGSFTMPATVGILFDDQVSGDDRIFLAQRPMNSDPAEAEFSFSWNNDIDAAVTFGAFYGSIEGSTELSNGKFEIQVADNDADGRVSFADLLGENPPVTVSPSGTVTADFTATIEGFPGNPIVARGNISALDNGSGNIFDVTQSVAAVQGTNPASVDKVLVGASIEGLDDAPMNLRLMVTGGIEAGKFIGRTIKKSQNLNPDLPVIGDVVTTVSTVGQVMEDIAFGIEEVWNDSRHDPVIFIQKVEAAVEVLVNHEILGDLTGFPDLDNYDGDCNAQGNACVTDVKIFGTLDDGSPFEINDGKAVKTVDDEEEALVFEEVLMAEDVIIAFTLLQEYEATIPSFDEGLDLEVWKLEFETGEITVTAGFEFNVGFGLSRTDGFYLLTNGPNTPENFHTLALFARIDNKNIRASSKILGVAGFTVGTEANIDLDRFVDDDGDGKPDLDDSIDPAADNGRLLFQGSCGGRDGDLDAACFYVDFNADTSSNETPDENAPASKKQTGKKKMSKFKNRKTSVDSQSAIGYDASLSLELPGITNVEVPVSELQPLFDAFPDLRNLPGMGVGDPPLQFPGYSMTAVFALEVTSDGNDLILALRDVKLNVGDAAVVIGPVLAVLDTFNPVSKSPIEDILTTEIPIVDNSILALAEIGVNELPNNSLETALVKLAGVTGLFYTNLLVNMDDTVQNFEGTGEVEFELGSIFITDILGGKSDIKFKYVGPGRDVVPAMDVLTSTLENGVDAVVDLLGEGIPDDIKEELAGLTDRQGQSLQIGPDIRNQVNEILQAQPLVSAFVDPPPLTYPLFEEASESFQMLLGQPARIVEFNPATPFVAGFGLKFSATLFSLNVGVASGEINMDVDAFMGVRGRLGVGFDTRGLQEGHDFIDGIYLIDHGPDITGNDDEVTAGGSIALSVDGRFRVVGGFVDISAGGSGGAYLTAGMDLNDESLALKEEDRGDGRFHLDELFTVIESSRDPFTGGRNPLCAFNYTARMGAFLEFFLTVKVRIVIPFVGDFKKTVFEERERLEISIVDERLSCTPDLPVAQVYTNSPPILALSVGPFAGNRPDQRGDVVESVTVVDVGSSYRVTAFSQVTDVPKCCYDGQSIALIYADGGLEDDEIIIDPSVTIPAVLIGGPGDDTLQGGSGNDVIIGDLGTATGDPGDDTLTGGAGNDLIVGMDLDDIISGGDGNDEIWGDEANKNLAEADVRVVTGNSALVLSTPIGGVDVNLPGNEATTTPGVGSGPGDDEITAGTGNDEVHGGPEDDLIEGGAGVDALFGDNGRDEISGGAGSDTINGGNDNDDLLGDDDNDVINGNDGRDNIEGNNGDDVIAGNDGNDQISGGDGVDIINGNDGDDHITGGRGEDQLHGDNGDDVINGNGDNDTINGNDGDDALFGDAGDDTINGGEGDDFSQGNGGNDTIHGNNGDDGLYGNDGDDMLFGDAGQDDLVGGTAFENTTDGADQLDGGDGNDFIAGDNASINRPVPARSDVFRPGRDPQARRIVDLFDIATTSTSPAATTYGNDTIVGGNGDDVIFGQGGDDNVHGNAGDDLVFGNAGGDTIYGGAGQDDLIGGTGWTMSNGTSTATSTIIDGRLDGDDTIYGGDGSGGVQSDDYDVIVGDNADVYRPVDPDGFWIFVQWDRWNEGASFVDRAIQRVVNVLDIPNLGNALDQRVHGDDTLHGEYDDDLIYGQDGNDTIRGGEGNDVIFGGNGDDDIFGDRGNDSIFGQGGIDHIEGGGGKDDHHGGEADAPSGICATNTSIQPENDVAIHNSNDNRLTNESKGRLEGSKGISHIKRKNPHCLQVVAIEIVPYGASVAVGSQVLLAAKATLTNGSTLDISNGVEWRSSNTGVFTVNSNGLVTGVGLGTATLSAVQREIASPGVEITVTAAP